MIFLFIVLAMVAREGPNTQDRVEHVTSATGHPFGDAMATCHPSGIAGDVAENHPTISVPSSSSGRKTAWFFTGANTAVCS